MHTKGYNMAFMVYWTEVQEDGSLVPRSKVFDLESMSDSLDYMSTLRIDQITHGNIRFICMSSENPNSVGKPGVATVGPDYNWTKRRNNMPGWRKT